MGTNNNFPLCELRDNMEKTQASLEKAESELSKEKGLSESIKEVKEAISSSLKNLK